MFSTNSKVLSPIILISSIYSLPVIVSLSELLDILIKVRMVLIESATAMSVAKMESNANRFMVPNVSTPLVTERSAVTLS